MMVSSTGSRASRRVRVWGLGKNVMGAERERGVGLWDEKKMRWREGLGRRRRAGRKKGGERCGSGRRNRMASDVFGLDLM